MGRMIFITKPFDVNELLARIHIQLRHAKNVSVNSKKDIQYKEISVNLDTREVKIHDQTLHLTGREYAILLLFLENPKKVYSRAVIRYWKEGDELIFSVKNDIKPDSKVVIEKVFMRFYTEVISRTNTETSGLGLYLSKKLVEKMNGKMEAELKEQWFILHIHLPMKETARFQKSK